MPVSVSVRHKLPPTLANLNSALFSMTGSEHRSRQHLLAFLLGPAFSAAHSVAIDNGIAAFLSGLTTGRSFHLMAEMRRLARLVAEQVLLGPRGAESQVGLEIQRYFLRRRRFAALGGKRGPNDLASLVQQGTQVDSLLRAQVRTLTQGAPIDDHGLLGHLCAYGSEQQLALTEDELIAHANVLFMSSSEPIATAMTWILLVLTQRPELCAAIRKELAGCSSARSPTLHGTVYEVLRLVPPSAILVRLTRLEAQVAGLQLQPPAEVIICPFAEHRRSDAFPEPHVFAPERWQVASPAAFQFLPFGAGARSCLGRRIALATMFRATSALLRSGDPILAHPQWLDWRMNLTLSPTPDPIVRLLPAGQVTVDRNKWSGPAADLFNK
jgi:cytochrome P450